MCYYLRGKNERMLSVLVKRNVMRHTSTVGLRTWRNLWRYLSTQSTGSASGLDGRVTVVLGAQWGDEGKGKLADVLAEK